MKPKDTIILLETKYVIVGIEKIPIRFTFRAMMDFENATGKSIQLATSTEDVVRLFYVLAKAGAKDKKVEFIYTFEDFLDLIDNHPESIVNFYSALSNGEEVDEKK